MNFRLAIAVCCLLVAVQARPKTEAGRCSLSCMSRSFWTGYETGKTYQYAFEQSAELSSSLSRSQSSRLQLKGVAKVAVHSECEMTLTVELAETKAGDAASPEALNPRETPAKVLAALRQPLRFSFENGRVVQLCPSSEETRASLNIKRGILSQLQVSAEQRGQAKQLQETDILGDCWTEYSPEGPNTLLKKKDFSRCKLAHQVYPLTGVKDIDQQTLGGKQQMTKGSVQCRIELDSEKDLVKEATCREEQTQSSDGTSNGAQERIRVRTKLTLQRTLSEIASVLSEIGERATLKHSHKTSEECQTRSYWLSEDLFNRGSECVERKSPADGRDSAHFKEMAKAVLQQLCDETKNSSVLRTTSKKFANLIKYLRGVSEQDDLKEIFDWVKGGFCSDNPMLSTLLSSAIPNVGTKQSVSLILDQLKKDEISDPEKKNWLVNGIANLRHPTSDMLPELLEFVRSRHTDNFILTRKEESLALAGLVYRICQEDSSCETNPKVKAVIDFFSDALGPSCSNVDDSPISFTALLAIGNLGRAKEGPQTLINCAKNKDRQDVNRAFALHSLRRFVAWSEQDIDLLLTLLQDQRVDSELRILAYQTLARVALTRGSKLLRAALTILESDTEDEQVQFFIYTHLQKVDRSAKPLVAPIISKRSVVNKMNKLSWRQYSSHVAGSYYSGALGKGVQGDANVIFSSKSAVPRYVNFNLTINDPSQGQAYNLLEIGLRMQGIEAMLEEFYDKFVEKFGPKKTDLTRRRRSVSQGLSAEQSSLVQPRVAPRVDVLMRKYGAQTMHFEFGHTVLQAIPEIIKAGQIKEHVANFLQPSDMESMGNTAGTISEETISIPTMAGLPILVKRETHFVTNMRIQKALNSVRYRNLDVEFQFKPMANVHTTRTVAIDAVFERAGIESTTSMMTSSGVKVVMQNNFLDRSDRKFTFKVEPLEHRQSLADVKTDVKFFQHDAEKSLVKKQMRVDTEKTTYDKCTGEMVQKYIGHKLCVKAEYAKVGSIFRSFQQTPGYFQVYLEKADDFRAFEATFNLVNKANNKQLLLLLGDRSSTERQLMLNLASQKTDTQGIYKVELMNPLCPLSWNWTVTKKTEESYELKADARVGRIAYKASASFNTTADNIVNIGGEVYRKEYKRPRLQFLFQHQFHRMLLFLPVANTQLQLSTHTGEQISAGYILDERITDASRVYRMAMTFNYADAEKTRTSFTWRSQYAKETVGGFVTNRLHHSMVSTYPASSRSASIQHGIELSFKRRQAGLFDITCQGIHSLKIRDRNSPIDFSFKVALKEEASTADLFVAAGTYEYTHFREGTANKKVNNIRLQIGEQADEVAQFEKLRVYSVSIDDTDIMYQLQLRHLPKGMWSLKKQSVELKAEAEYKTGERQKYVAHFRHALNFARSIVSQVFKFEHPNNEVSSALSINGDRMMHELFIQSIAGKSVGMNTTISWPRKTLKLNTGVAIDDEKIFGAKHEIEYQELAAQHQLMHKMQLQLRSQEYAIDDDMKISKEAAEIFWQYLYSFRSSRYNAWYTLRLLRSFLASLQYEDKHSISGPTASKKMEMSVVINTKAANGIVWKTEVKKTDHAEVTNYSGILKRTSSGEGMQKNVPWKQGVELEITAADKNVKTNAEVTVTKKDDNQYDAELTIDSSDAWNLHKVKVEGKTSLENGQKKKMTVEMKTNGEVLEQKIDSAINVDFESEYKEAKMLYRLQTSVTAADSKLQFGYDFATGASELQATVKFDSDIWFMAVKDFEATLDTSRRKEIPFKLIVGAKLDKQEKAAMQIRCEQGAFRFKISTAHPMLRETETVFTWSGVQENGFRKFTSLFKLDGYGTKMEFKEDGELRMIFGSESHFFDLAVKSDMENVITKQKYSYELVTALKRSFEFRILAEVQNQQKATVLRATSTYSKWPFKAEAKLRTNYGTEIGYGFRVEFENLKAFAGIELAKKEALVGYEIEDTADSKKKIFFRMSNNFLMETDQLKTVSGEGRISWPLNAENFMGDIEIQLPVKKAEKIKLEVTTQSNSNHALRLTVVTDGRTQKLIEGSYSRRVVEDKLLLDGLFHIDLKPFVPEFEGLNFKANATVSEETVVNIIAKTASGSRTHFSSKLFSLERPIDIEGVDLPQVRWGVLFKTAELNAYFVVGKYSEKFQYAGQVNIAGRSLAKVKFQYDESVSGEAEFNGYKYQVSHLPDRSLEFSAKPSEGSQPVYRIRMSDTRTEPNPDTSCAVRKLEIDVGEATNKIEYRKCRSGGVRFETLYEILYGNAASPNSLKVVQSAENFGMKNELTHTVNPANSEISILPGHKISLPTMQFNITHWGSSDVKILNLRAECPRISIWSFTYRHDVTKFPRSFEFDSSLRQEENSEAWKSSISIDLDESKVEVSSQAVNYYKLLLRNKDLTFRINDVIDVEVELPSAESLKTEIKLTIPILEITEQIVVKAGIEGKEVTAEYQYGTGMKINAAAKMTKFELKPLNIDVEASLSSQNALFADTRAVGLEFQSQMANSDGKYSLTGSAVLKRNSADWSTTTVSINGEENGIPTNGEIKMSGVTESTLTFDCNSPNGAKMFNFKLEKIGSKRTTFDVQINLGASKPGVRDFKVSVQCPRRLYVISKEAKASGEVVSELYLNKNNKIGFTVTYKLELEAPKPKLNVELELPTRKLAFDIELEKEARKYSVSTNFAWDKENAPRKSIGADLEVNYDAKTLFAVELKAPFLKENVKVICEKESTSEGNVVEVKYSNGERGDQLSAKVQYRLEGESGKTTIVMETSGASGAADVTLEVEIQPTANEEESDKKKYRGSVKLTLPAQSVERSIKFVYIPMRELTYTCNRGSAASFRIFASGPVKQLRIFVADYEKKAARLTGSFDQQKLLLKAVLHVGSGEFDYNSDLRTPEFRPEAKLISASAGITSEDKEAHVGLFAGRMSIGQEPSVRNATEVPAGLSFFVAGMQLQEGSRLEYFTNWRPAASDDLKSAVDYIQEAILDTWTSSSVQSFGSIANNALQAAADKVKSNIDIEALVTELQDFASKDLDRLSKFLEAAYANNDFYARDIYGFAQRVVEFLQMCVDVIDQVLKDIQRWLASWQVNLRIAEFVRSCVSQAAQFCRDIRYAEMWQKTVTATFAFCRQIADGYTAGVQSIKDYCQWLYNVVYDPSGAESLFETVAAMVDDVMPFGWTTGLYAEQFNRLCAVLKRTAGIAAQEIYDSFLKPYVFNHIADAGSFVRFYNDLLLEARIWYDTGATTEERQAYSRLEQIATLLTSEEARLNWRNLARSYELLLNGQVTEAADQLLQLSTNVVSVWRPNCDEECAGGSGFATVQGSVYIPVYMRSLNPRTWKAQWEVIRTPKMVMQRIRRKLFATSSDGYVVMSMLNDWRQLGASYWDPIARLLAIKHRTAIIQGDNHLITFDGVTLMHTKPCRYLVAAETSNSRFTIWQTYRKQPGSSQPQRNQLLVRFGSAEVSISRDGVFKLNNNVERLPIEKSVGGNKIEATKVNRVIEARFHANVKDILIVRCSLVTDSCVLKVHPLYHGKVIGFAGTNDGRKSNDIHMGNAEEHLRMWHSDQCLEEGSASVEVPRQTAGDVENDCRRWFQIGAASFDKCFGTVAPKPYYAMCAQYQQAGKDICQVATLYIERCRNELVNVNTPRSCVRCRLSSGREIRQQDTITNQAELRKITQVVFLVENSRCGLDAIGAGQSTEGSVQYLAKLIDRLGATDSETQFGLAVYGGASEEQQALKPYRIAASSSTFGTYRDLVSALHSGMDSPAASTNELDVLKAIAQLQEKYEWEPLAQKHVVVISCKRCTTRSWNYARLFDQAFKVVRDQIHVHHIEKDIIPEPTRADDWKRGMVGYDRQKAYFLNGVAQRDIDLSLMGPPAGCVAELAMDRQTQARGSVWSLEQFSNTEAEQPDARPASAQTGRLVFSSQFQRRFQSPPCRRCRCALSELMTARPKCHIVRCP